MQRIADLEKEVAKRDRWIDQRDRRIDKLEQENKVEIRRPPRNESWGGRTFDIVDHFGNTIFVIGPVTLLHMAVVNLGDVVALSSNP